MSRLAFPAIPVAPRKPWTRKGMEYVGLTTETLAAFRADWAHYEQAIREWRAACDNIAGEAARLLIAQGFPAEVKVGRVTRALNQALREFGPLLVKTTTLWLSDEEQWLRQADSRKRQTEREQEVKALRNRAVTWLLTRGKIYGVEFVAEDAPDVALKIAAEEKITELRKAQPWQPFNGWNCMEWDEIRECKGWDGEARRCQCGNRRVSWEISGTFEAPHVYGEAW